MEALNLKIEMRFRRLWVVSLSSVAVRLIGLVTLGKLRIRTDGMDRICEKVVRLAGAEWRFMDCPAVRNDEWRPVVGVE